MRLILKENLDKLIIICRKRQVKRLYSFGSVNTEQFNKDSDIDLLVDFGEMKIEEYADNFFEMCYDLEELFGRSVDLVTTRSVKNPIFKEEIETTKQLLYDIEKELVNG
jgi:predicted nucleotidyltransferase